MSKERVGSLARSGAIDPATTLVWRQGLKDWMTLGESGILAEIGSIPQVAPVQASNNPYQVSERTRNALDEPRQGAMIEYPGYGRLRYFLITMVFTILCYAIAAAIGFAMYGSKPNIGVVVLVVIAVFSAMLAGSIYIGVQRLKNLGMSGLALFWMFVPFMNMWLGWRMIACPPGYEDHRTLDTPAKVITGIWIGSMVLAFAAGILGNLAQH